MPPAAAPLASSVTDCTMLPISSRLRNSADFTATVRAGGRAGCPELVVHALTPPPSETGTPQDTVRVGFVVSRAVGNAVTRNRVKRRLRHAVPALMERTPAGSRLVVRALPPSATADWTTLQRQLTRCWERALDATPRLRR